MAAYPWIQSYPDGVRWDAELPTMPVQQLLDDAVARWPEHPALEFMGRTLSYREFGALADRAAKGFQQLGVKPGVHVGLYLPNSPHYPIAFFGVLKAGGTVVNYSPLDAERVLEHKIENSETDVLVTLDLGALYPQMARLLGRSRLKKLVVGSLAEFAAQPDAVRAHLQKAGQLSAVASDDKHVSFDSAAGQRRQVPAASDRRPEGRGRRAAVHRRHHRPAQGRDADACQPVVGLRAVHREHARAIRRSWAKASSARWSCCRCSTSTRSPSTCCSACAWAR